MITQLRAYIAIAVLLALVAGYGYAYHSGVAAEKARGTAAAFKAREKENVLIARLEESKTQREVIYRDKVKIVHDAAGVCLDAPLPDSIVSVLRRDSNSPKAQP